jgi:hypothetical protein
MLADLQMQPVRHAFYGVVCTFAKAWLDHISPGKTNMEIRALEILKPGKSIMKSCADEADNLLGPTSKYWLKEALNLETQL